MPPATYAFHSPSILPCLMEESPSDSGLSDGTKTTHNDDAIDTPAKHAAMIDLSKPLSREEMLAIIQVVRELWKKQFGSEILDVHIKAVASPTNSTPSRRSAHAEKPCYLSNNNKNHYHSTPTLNKLSAELSDIKDKLQKFSNGRVPIERPKIIVTEEKPLGRSFSSFFFFYATNQLCMSGETVESLVERERITHG